MTLEEVRLGRLFVKPIELAGSPNIHMVFIKDESENALPGKDKKLNYLVPKANEVVKIREIHHLSAPDGCSINDSIKYAAIRLVRVIDIGERMSPGNRFAKIDLKRYYVQNV